MRGLVLFDFAGTLDADGARWSTRFHSAYRAAGGKQSLAAFEKVFRESDRALGRYTGIEKLGFRAMVDAQAALLLSRLPDGAAITQRQIADEFHATTWAVVQRNAVLLERLQQSYHLGVVANFTGNLEICLSELGLMKYFSVVADSARIGVTKPDARLFQHALTWPGLVSTPAWMVGDDFEADIRPAAALGLSTAWLAPPGVLQRSRETGAPSGIPTVRLTVLSDLAPVLEAAVPRP